MDLNTDKYAEIFCYQTVNGLWLVVVRDRQCDPGTTSYGRPYLAATGTYLPEALESLAGQIDTLLLGDDPREFHREP